MLALHALEHYVTICHVYQTLEKHGPGKLTEICNVFNALRACSFCRSLQAALPSIQSSKNGSRAVLSALHTEAGKLAVTVTSLKQDTDIIINAFLREEQKVHPRLPLLHIMLHNHLWSGGGNYEWSL